MYNPNWSSSNGNDDNSYWCTAGINAAAAAAAANCAEAFYASCHRLPTTAAAAAAVAAAKFQQHGNSSNPLYGPDGQPCQYSSASSVLSTTDPTVGSAVPLAVPSTSTTSAPNFFGYPTPQQASDFMKVGNYDSWFTGAANSYVHPPTVIGADATPFGHHASPTAPGTNPYGCQANGSSGLIPGSINIAQHANHAARLAEPKQPLFPWMKYSGMINFFCAWFRAYLITRECLLGFRDNIEFFREKIGTPSFLGKILRSLAVNFVHSGGRN